MLKKRVAASFWALLLLAGARESSAAQAVGPLEELVRQARQDALEGRWTDARLRVEPAIDASTDENQAVRAAAQTLVAEALWRGGRTKEALSRIDAALPTFGEPRFTRPLLVLDADILFADGRVDEACAQYASAEKIATSPWVVMQLRRCAAPEPDDASSEEPKR